MYKSFYSLSKEPFSKDIHPTEAYPSEDYQGALGALAYLKQSKGMGTLTGEPGAGKTFALRSFKASLNPSLFHVVYFPLSTGGVMDFYRGLVYGLGEEPRFRKVDLFRQIQSGIERMTTELKITPVFILDEMHLAKDAFLQDLAILFNFEMDSSNPFILVLAGLPYLKRRLSLNHNRPLAQRMIMTYDIQPMSRSEVAAYIEHHMKLAGAKLPLFEESAIEAITTRTHGWPRAINMLTIEALLYGSQMKKEKIDEAIIQHAVEQRGLL